MSYRGLRALFVYFTGAVDKEIAQEKLEQALEGPEIENLKGIPEVEEQRGHLVAKFEGYDVTNGKSTKALFNAIERISQSCQEVANAFDTDANRLTKIPEWQHLELPGASQEAGLLLVRNAPPSNEPG